MSQNRSIVWQSPEYTYRENSVDWFWAVGIIATTTAIVSIVYGNILFAIFIIIGAFTLLMYAARRPRTVNFTLNERGIYINKILYPFNTLDSFWIHKYDKTADKLIIKSKKMLMPYISIILPNDDSAEDIHRFIIKYLPEEEHRESMPEAIMEYLGF